MTCTLCIHFSPYTNQVGELGGGVCRRYPPVPLLIPEYQGGERVQVVVPQLPEVYPRDYCGEFKEKAA